MAFYAFNTFKVADKLGLDLLIYKLEKQEGGLLTLGHSHRVLEQGFRGEEL